MNKNKKILVLLVLVVAAGLVYFFLSQKQEGVFTVQKPKQMMEENLLSVSAENVSDEEGNKIVVYLNPLKENVSMAAFSFKATLKQDSITKTAKLIKSQKLVDDAWSFPIFRFNNPEEVEGQQIVEVAGFRLGNAPYYIAEKIPLFEIQQDNLSVSLPEIMIDRENTKFYSSDAVTELPY